METSVRERLQMIALVLVVGLGAGLLVQMFMRGESLPSPDPAEQAAADRVTMLVASAFSGSVMTTASLYEGGTVDVGTDALAGTSLADPARTSLAVLTTAAAQRVDQGDPLEARVAPREVAIDQEDGRTVIEARTAVTTLHRSAPEATVILVSTTTLDDASGTVLSFEATGLG